MRTMTSGLTGSPRCALKKVRLEMPAILASLWPLMPFSSLIFFIALRGAGEGQSRRSAPG
jgi:hypothetical protein